MNQLANDLKPCPFCGYDKLVEDVVLKTDGNLSFVRCTRCNAKGPWSGSKLTRAEKWNARVIPEAANRDAIIEECADLADQHLDVFSDTTCSYRCDVAEAIRGLKIRAPQAQIIGEPPCKS